MDKIEFLLDRYQKAIYITFREEKIRLDMDLYCKSAPKNDFNDPFMVVERCINDLAYNKPNMLKDLFDQFKELVQIKQKMDLLDILTEDVKTIIKNISKILPIQDVVDWYKYNSLIRIPSDIKNDVKELIGIPPINIHQTYLREDYIGLCGLSVVMTLLSPFFSDYAGTVSKTRGTEWKIYETYRLLDDSDYALANGNPYLERLMLCIGSIITSNPYNINTLIFIGLTEEEFPEWLMGNVLIKKIAFGDVSGKNEQANLIKFVYNYVKSKITGLEKDFKVDIKPMKYDTSAVVENNSVSQLETRSLRQNIPDNIIVINQYYLQNQERCIQQLFKKMPYDKERLMSLLQEHMEYILPVGVGMRAHEHILESEIGGGQITLIKWVMSLVIPHRIIDHCDKPTIASAMITSACFLWYNGFYELAALVSAVPYRSKDGVVISSTSVERRNRLRTADNDKLKEIYKYPRTTTGKNKQVLLPIQVNGNDTSKLLSQNDWYLTIPQSWMDEVEDIKFRQFQVSAGIRLELYDLALLIDKIKREYSN